MTLRLFEHNEKAYRVETRMMEQYGKAAIAHPTGTGKSYIVFKLIEEHSDSVIFWLSPSVYIFKTQIENLKRQDPDFPLENVCFCAYAKLMRALEQEDGLDKVFAHHITDKSGKYIVFCANKEHMFRRKGVPLANGSDGSSMPPGNQKRTGPICHRNALPC